MMALPSIRERLLRALVVVALVWGLVVSSVVWLIVRHEVDELMDATLQEAAEVLYGVLPGDLANVPRLEGNLLPAPPHKEDLSWQIVAPGPTLLLRSHGAPIEPLQGPQARGFVSVQGWRLYAMSLEGSRVLLVAQPMRQRTRARLEAAEYSAGAALVVGLAGALWLSLRVRRELEPLSALSRDVQAYDPLLPLARLSPVQRAELQPMHAAVIELGTRLARRVRSEQAFSAHAAHALRTPLAGMVAQLATAQRVSPPQAQPMLALTRQAADRLRRVVTALLALFRTGSELHWAAIDLPNLVAQLPIDGLDVSADPAPGLQADADLLLAALANLLENAARHGAKRAHLRARYETGLWVLTLCDDGPGIDEDRRKQLQQAIDAQDYEGQTGLGLMLADLVARAHGGGLRLLADADGCAAQLSWPLPGEPVKELAHT